MAVELTPRLGIPRWPLGTDPYRRSQRNTNADQLEALAAIDKQGTLAARPAPTAATRGTYYTVVGDTASNNDRIYRSDGTRWLEVLTGPGGSGSANVKSFGAVGDGIADDTVAIQAALSNVFGRRLVVPPGTYRITASLVIPSNTHLDLAPGAVLDGTGLAADVPIIKATGTVSNAAALTASAAAGAVALSVAAGAQASFPAGSFVRVRSERNVDPGEGPKDGEVHAVRSTASGVVNLIENLWESYATGDAATVELVNAVRNIKITGGTLRGSGLVGSTGVQFEHVRDAVLDGVVFEDFAKRATRFIATLNLTVTSCTFYRSNQEGFGYGVGLSAGCQWVAVVGNHWIDCRHGIAAGGSTGDYGINRFVAVTGNSGYGGLDAAIDSHSSSQFWTITGNVVTFGANATGSGIIYQGREVVITDNVVERSDGTGINYQPVPQTIIDGVVIANNVVRNAQGVGIFCDIRTNVTLRGLTISGNSVVGALGAAGIYCRVTFAGSSLTDYAITGNTVRDAAGRGVWVRAQAGPVAWGVIGSNRVGVRAAQNAVQLGADAGQTLDRTTITGNAVNGGSNGIINSGGATNAWVDGNTALGTTAGVSGFVAAELGTNRTA